MRQHLLLILAFMMLLLLVPKAYAQEREGIIDRITDSNRTPYIQSATFCYKQNGMIYLPEYGFTTTDCRFNTDLVYLDVKGATGLASDSAVQDLTIPESVKSSTQAQEAFNFYSMLVNDGQREILAQKNFTTPDLALPDILLKVAPELNGTHEVTFNTWTEFLSGNSSTLNFTATVN